MTTGLLVMGLAFAGGWWLRRLDWAGPQQAEYLLHLVVWFGLPALIFSSVSTLPWQPGLMLLPLVGACLVATVGLCAWLLARRRTQSPSIRGVLVTGPMIMNLALWYPLVASWGGDQAVARLALIDFGNGLLTFTLVYGLAARYGGGGRNLAGTLGAMLRFPPFWALWLALLVNLLHWSPPALLLDGLRGLGTTLVWLVPVALGIHFRLRAGAVGITAWGVLLRVGVGALLGLALVWLLPLDTLSGAVVLAAAVAPVGFNALVFAAREGLDRDLAANLVSWSVPPALLLLALMFRFQPAMLP